MWRVYEWTDSQTNNGQEVISKTQINIQLRWVIPKQQEFCFDLIFIINYLNRLQEKLVSLIPKVIIN